MIGKLLARPLFQLAPLAQGLSVWVVAPEVQRGSDNTGHGDDNQSVRDQEAGLDWASPALAMRGPVARFAGISHA